MNDTDKLNDCIKRLADLMRKEAALKMFVANVGWVRRGSAEERRDIYEVAA